MRYLDDFAEDAWRTVGVFGISLGTICILGYSVFMPFSDYVIDYASNLRDGLLERMIYDYLDSEDLAINDDELRKIEIEALEDEMMELASL